MLFKVMGEKNPVHGLLFMLQIVSLNDLPHEIPQILWNCGIEFDARLFLEATSKTRILIM